MSPKKHPLRSLHVLLPWLGRFGVGQRFLVGYGLAISIAIAGTAIGGSLAQLKLNAGWKRVDQVSAVRDRFSDLRVELLEIIAHPASRKANTIQTPADVQALWQEIERHAIIAEESYTWLAEWADKPDASQSALGPIHDRWTVTLQSDRAVAERFFRIVRRRLLSVDSSLAADGVPFDRELHRWLIVDFQGRVIRSDITRLTIDVQNLLPAIEEIQKTVEAEQRLLSVAWWFVFGGSSLLSLAVAIAIGSYISRSTVTPIESMAATARNITTSGQFERRFEVVGNDEISDLSQAFNASLDRVQTLLDEQEQTTTERLLAGEKLSSLGRMLAEVAHELNNPINYLSGNIPHCKTYVGELCELLAAYEAEVTDPSAELEELAEELDREFLETDLKKLIASMEVGAQRARQIILGLKNSSRTDDERPSPLSLQDSVEGTLAILYNRLKKGIDLETSFADLPSIEGFPGSLYQIFSNLIGNAIDAVNENDRAEKRIRIATEQWDEHHVAVRIHDNGGGIPDSVRDRIFEAFFTTKPTGVGTGLGLAIVKQLVEEKHGGRLLLETTPGDGTEFIVVLPMQADDRGAAALTGRESRSL